MPSNKSWCSFSKAAANVLIFADIYLIFPIKSIQVLSSCQRVTKRMPPTSHEAGGFCV